MLYFVKFFVVFLGIFCYLLCNCHISSFSNHKTPVLTHTFPIYWHKKRVLKTELFFCKISRAFNRRRNMRISCRRCVRRACGRGTSSILCGIFNLFTAFFRSDSRRHLQSERAGDHLHRPSRYFRI